MKAVAKHGLLWLAVLLPALLVASSSAGELEVVVGRAGLDEYEAFVHIAGTILNRSQDWVCTPQIDVSLFDPDGKPIEVTSIVTVTRQELGRAAQDGCVAERDWLPPGEIAIFHYIRDVTKLGGARYGSQRLSVSARECPRERPRVVIEGFEVSEPDPGWYSVKGRIRNVGDVACYSAEAIVGLFRADGKLFEAQSEQPDVTFQKLLQPGQSVDFGITSIQNPDGVVTDLKAWADCGIPY